MTVLEVRHLGKSYPDYGSELVRIGRWFGLPLKPKSEHWVLQDVSFKVGKGESLGIVGKNGAGKSTLLKMVTGVLHPSQGSIEVQGKIAAILELGMGFNPALTGRMNVYHALGLMGYAQRDIEAVMPEVEAFAEIGTHFDAPLRTYSSGMQMRVAFAVATAFCPDILIVDEALAVGDAYFQHKSFDRIREMQQKGTSLLLVSHDPSSIQALCDRTILLQNGRLAMEGDPEAVLDYYNASLASHQEQQIHQEDCGQKKVKTSSGTGEALISHVQLLNNQGMPVEIANVGEELVLDVGVLVHEDLKKLVFGFSIRNHLGQILYGTNTFHTKQVQYDLKKGSEVKFRAKLPANFGVGSYSIQLALASSDTHMENNYDWQDLAYIFKVANLTKDFFVGMTWLETKIEIK